MCASPRHSALTEGVNGSKPGLEVDREASEASTPLVDGQIAASFRGDLLARNTIWNLVGNATPLIVAVLVIPVLIKHLGTVRYGILTIAWGVVGSFGVFDM